MPTDLTNMKRPPPKAKTEATCAPCAMPQEEYPYGLRIHLDQEQLEQLAIDKLPEVGSEVLIQAKAKVVSVNEGASDHDKRVWRNVGLQITDMALAAPKSKKATENVFYADDEKA